jgi:hypothetical protein
MRMLLLVTFPTEKFNELWRKGEVGPKIREIIEDTKPEAIYFGKGANGQRGAVVVVDVPTEADLPRVTEPWYLVFDARIETSICMTAEDVAKQDYKDLAKKYA